MMNSRWGESPKWGKLVPASHRQPPSSSTTALPPPPGPERPLPEAYPQPRTIAHAGAPPGWSLCCRPRAVPLDCAVVHVVECFCAGCEHGWSQSLVRSASPAVSRFLSLRSAGAFVRLQSAPSFVPAGHDSRQSRNSLLRKTDSSFFPRDAASVRIRWRLVVGL
jgi:hypothetical protein